MKTQTLLVDFIRGYGVKEGVILSELCRRVCLNGNAACCFSVPDCTRLFDYLTEKQIRTSINRLLEHGCIVHAGPRDNFDRTIRFRVSDKAYRSYFNAVIGNEQQAGS
jgi:hypothetical protein